MYLFFDTETTGLPRNRNAPVTDLDNWPRLVRISWSQHDDQGSLFANSDYIIKPNGFTIPLESTRIHGISNEKALREGADLKGVLSEFLAAINQAVLLVAHNMKFDEMIVGAELVREDLPISLFKKRRICTMESAVYYCKLPGKGGYKPPSLLELHRILFGIDFKHAHNSVSDVEACAKSFFELKRLGVIALNASSPPTVASERKKVEVPFIPPETSREGSHEEQMAKIKAKYPNAYQKWTDKDVRMLTQKFEEGLSIAELAEFFGRQPSAIQSRLLNLDLITIQYNKL